MFDMHRKYDDGQISLLLDLYFRNQPRPAPWPVVGRALGVRDTTGLDDLLWKVLTGYSGNMPDGPRRATPRRGRHRAGYVWWPREDGALHAALRGEGQRRCPPCDTAYIAAVLARTEEEVKVRWAHLNQDTLDRSGFGLLGKKE